MLPVFKPIDLNFLIKRITSFSYVIPMSLRILLVCISFALATIKNSVLFFNSNNVFIFASGLKPGSTLEAW